MSTKHQQRRSGNPAPVFRYCALCGQAKTIYPPNEEHRKAHMGRQLAFVCDDCAERVRMEVEAAGGPVNEPRFTA